MKPSSAKAKGRKFQQWVRDAMLSAAPWLKPDDVQSRSMGASGEDLMLSPFARDTFPVSSEAKCQESLNIWAALAQAEERAGAYVPVVFFKRNHSQEYAALPAVALLNLYAELSLLKNEVA